MKLMIADDEKWVRAAIKSIIPFDRLGLKLVCEAANGIEALELCAVHQPDILLTDIMMPGMNGLELIRELRSLQPELKIAIISGYSDFEYARTAMKYGITQYLLKPVDETELVPILEAFIMEIARERDAINTNMKKISSYEKALPLLCEAFLNKAVTYGSLTAENIRSTLADYNIHFPYPEFSIAVFSPDNHEAFGSRENSGYFVRILSRIFRRRFGAVTFQKQGRQVEAVAILNYQGSLDPDEIKKAFMLANRLLEKNCGATCTAGVSRSTRQLAMLAALYSQASSSLLERFFKGPAGIHLCENCRHPEEFPLKLTEEISNRISLNLRMSNIQPALSFIDSSAEAMKSRENISPELAREFLWQFLQSVLGILNVQMQFIHQYSLQFGEHPYDRLKRTVFVDELHECSKDMVMKIFDLYHDKNQIDNTSVIDKAKKLIENNYSGDINLEQVARHVHLSPAYLSELFKKETGMSFIDYKTIVRLDNAKKLLETTLLGINDISAKVGYTDPKYFSKLFKKLTGKTVYEYRKDARR